MKLKTGILIIFLVIGLLGVPNCVFAQPCESSASDIVLKNTLPDTMHLNALNPEVKGGGGGGRGGGSSGSKSSSSKKLKTDGDDNDTDTDDGSSGWLIAIIIIVILGIIGLAVWYFFLRK